MKDAFRYLWIIGGTLAVIGEAVTAFDKKKGNTISEFFDSLPRPAQAFILVGIGAVLQGGL